MNNREKFSQSISEYESRKLIFEYARLVATAYQEQKKIVLDDRMKEIQKFLGKNHYEIMKMAGELTGIERL